MHFRRSDLNEPEDEAILWRYFALDKFRSLVSTKSLYLRRADKFDDPLEGKTPGGTVRAIFDELPQDIAPILVGIRNLFVGKMFVSCWHENLRESSTMWSAYGDQSRGVAVKTTGAKLRQSLIGPEACVVARVCYLDFNQDVGSNDTTKQMLQKRREFSGESEVRVVHDVGMSGGLLSKVGQPDSRDAIFHAISLKSLVEEIVVGSLCTVEEETEVRHLARGFDLEPATQRSRLYLAKR